MPQQPIFPLFRKYGNNKSWFKVLSFQAFEELQVVGSHYETHRIEATTMPERNYINEMIENAEGRYQEISQEEFKAQKSYCQSNLKPLPGVK